MNRTSEIFTDVRLIHQPINVLCLSGMVVNSEKTLLQIGGATPSQAGAVQRRRACVTSMYHPRKGRCALTSAVMSRGRQKCALPRHSMGVTTLSNDTAVGSSKPLLLPKMAIVKALST